MKKYLLYFLTMLLTINATAQEKHILCGSDEYHQSMYESDAKYKESYNKTQAFLKERNITNYKTVTTASGTEYHVPVVVHVIHTGGAVGSNYNPNASAINALITQINNGFANTFNNTSVSGIFNGVNIPIRFYLAQRTEGCVTTTGINRINNSTDATYVASGVSRGGTNPGITDVALKALAHWNDLNYYNIYIVNKINGVDGNTPAVPFVAGYANYPILGGYDRDGMVCLAAAAANATSTVFIHELGHGFNLAHTFNGGSTTACPPNANCATDNDGICDTEPIRQSFTCNPTGNNICTGLPYTGTQWNYMSYNGCTDRFSAGQSTKVQSALNNVRTSLKNSAGIDPPPAVLTTAAALPTFNAANVNHNFTDGIYNVTFNSINHTSEGYAGEGSGHQFYVDNACNQSTTLILGAAYPISVSTVEPQSMVKVYIDLNNDGVFGTTAPEMVFSSATTTTNFTHTGSVSIPIGSTLSAPLRMRVVSDYGTVLNNVTPTMQLDFGQVEDFTVNVIGAPLPVLWHSITANLNHRSNVDVRWSTEIEHNSSIFEIEKSKDGFHFYTIGSMKAAGNSHMRTYYNFEDEINLNGYNYYRIKQIDIDGHSTYSTVATEIINSNDTENDIVIFPNPTSGHLNINLAGLTLDQNIVKYTITDLNGKIWSTRVVKVINSHTQLNENIESLPSGLYFVQMRINDKLSVHKIAKQF